ncbi:unnamed protein product [Amoebophrya sp. A120]|nr:unnamed protein product [Amoebophrya sp. A120]|eukprot:GSA120T00007215001.1
MHALSGETTSPGSNFVLNSSCSRGVVHDSSTSHDEHHPRFSKKSSSSYSRATRCGSFDSTTTMDQTGCSSYVGLSQGSRSEEGDQELRSVHLGEVEQVDDTFAKLQADIAPFLQQLEGAGGIHRRVAPASNVTRNHQLECDPWAGTLIETGTNGGEHAGPGAPSWANDSSNPAALNNHSSIPSLNASFSTNSYHSALSTSVNNNNGKTTTTTSNGNKGSHGSSFCGTTSNGGGPMIQNGKGQAKNGVDSATSWNGKSGTTGNRPRKLQHAYTYNGPADHDPRYDSYYGSASGQYHGSEVEGDTYYKVSGYTKGKGGAVAKSGWNKNGTNGYKQHANPQNNGRSDSYNTNDSNGSSNGGYNCDQQDKNFYPDRSYSNGTSGGAANGLYGYKGGKMNPSTTYVSNKNGGKNGAAAGPSGCSYSNGAGYSNGQNGGTSGTSIKGGKGGGQKNYHHITSGAWTTTAASGKTLSSYRSASNGTTSSTYHQEKTTPSFAGFNGHWQQNQHWDYSSHDQVGGGGAPVPPFINKSKSHPKRLLHRSATTAGTTTTTVGGSTYGAANYPSVPSTTSHSSTIYATTNSEFLEAAGHLKPKAALESRSWANLKQLSRKHTFDAKNWHKYTYYAILDFEATCEHDHSIEPEVIEFPTVILDVETLEVVAEFRKFVKPVLNPKLKYFCRNLTGITQEEVDNAGDFPGVYQDWKGFMAHFPNSLLITCGDWDVETMLPGQLKLCGLPDDVERSFCNIKIIFANLLGDPRKHKNYVYYRNNKQDAMVIMLEACALQLDGRHHSGLDDSRNIAKIVKYIAENYGEHCLVPTTLHGERMLERIFF